MEYLDMRDGKRIPAIGFGTYGFESDSKGIDTVLCALEAGYRLIDTASKYGTESCVGDALLRSRISREQLFITSKLWIDQAGYDGAIKACKDSLERLRLDYLDLYMIHWPASKSRSEDPQKVNRDTWEALLTLKEEGLIRSAGVCNFTPKYMKMLPADNLPVVNQIEFHPGLMQNSVRDYCKANDILIQGWTPLGRGTLLTNPVICGMALNRGKTPAQICLRWAVQHGAIPLPRSINPDRIKSNINIFDFTLTSEEMQAIDALPDGIGASLLDPDTYTGMQSSAQNI